MVHSLLNQWHDGTAFDLQGKRERKDAGESEEGERIERQDVSDEAPKHETRDAGHVVLTPESTVFQHTI